MLKIKEDKLDTYITAPISNAIIYVREIDPILYPRLKQQYPDLFEPEVVIKPKKEDDVI